MIIYECDNGHLNFDCYVGMECLECNSTSFHRVEDIERLKQATEQYETFRDEERKHQCVDAVLLLLARKTDPSIEKWYGKHGGVWFA